MHTKVASDFLTYITNKQYLGKLLYVFVAIGNQIFFSTGNQTALNLFQSLKLAVYVKGCLCAWESYVSLSNAKYPSIFISVHQNLQLWQKSYCYLYTAISVPKRWNIFMRNTQAVSKHPKLFFWKKWSGSWEKLQTASDPMASPCEAPQQETTHLLGWWVLPRLSSSNSLDS